MIKFEADKDKLKEAVFAGSTSDIAAELAIELSLIYGSLEQHDKDAAEDFKKMIMLTVFDPMGLVWSSSLASSLSKSDQYETTCITVKGNEEFIEKIREINGNADEGEYGKSE